MSLVWQYSPLSRAERLVAALRVVLAVSSIGALRLDPSDPANYAQVTSWLMAGYAIYSVGLAGLAWLWPLTMARLRLASHVFDLACFTLFMYLTEGPTSPFFAYFVFAVLAGTLRWGLRGTVATTIVALGTFFTLGMYASEIAHVPQFRLNDFIIRSVYLAVVGACLGYLAAHDQKVHRDLEGLARWPQVLEHDLTSLLTKLLKWVSASVGAPRVLAVWEEAEEPWTHVAVWADEELQLSKEGPDTFGGMIAKPLAASSFISPDVSEENPVALYRLEAGIREWRGRPVHDELVRRFGITSLLAVPFKGETASGCLLTLDKEKMTLDDLVLGELAGRQVCAALDHYHLLDQLRQLAVSEERIRLARDLHDGLFQSLTAARLQLQTIAAGPEVEVRGLKERLIDLERAIGTEQRDLRSFIQQLKVSSTPIPRAGLSNRLRDLAGRIEWQWGLRVELRFPPDLVVPEPLAHQVYLMIHEALVNVARHGEASKAVLEVRDLDGDLQVTVRDNGRGFPFRGRRDHHALAREGAGPVSLRERVTSLGGGLVVESTNAGAVVEMTVPMGALVT